MAVINPSPSSKDGTLSRPIFLSQKELAERWKMTACSIKNMRGKGGIPFFSPPGSNRILYPINEIEAIEQQHLAQKEVPDDRTQEKVSKRERPLVPPKTAKKWEV